MKVSDAVAEFLAMRKVTHVFCISGGASLHLIHSIAARSDIAYICPQNEQAAGFMADAQARLTGTGCALATSGPGATNLITPIGTSYYDSIPALYLTGNQTLERLKPYGRQYGFQATPICDLVRPITKAALQPQYADQVIPMLEHAWASMHDERMGPALVDIPDDLQRAQC